MFFVTACYFIQVFLVFYASILKNVIPWWLKGKLCLQPRPGLPSSHFSHRHQRNLNVFNVVFYSCRQTSVICFVFSTICFTLSPGQRVDVSAYSQKLGKVCDLPPNINKACTGLQSQAGNNYPGRLSGKGGHMVGALSEASFNSCEAF